MNDLELSWSYKRLLDSSFYTQTDALSLVFRLDQVWKLHFFGTSACSVDFKLSEEKDVLLQAEYIFLPATELSISEGKF